MQARQITLNLVPGGVMPRIHCSQYDKGVPVEVTIYDGDTTYTIPQDATVYVQGTKLDGTLYQYECTYSGSVVYFDLTIQMTVIAGENTAELSIYDSNEDIVGTCNFVIDVEDSALQDSSETSYNDIPVIADLPGLVKTAEEAAQTAVDAADGVELDMDEIREAVSKSSTSAQLASGYAVDSENYYLLSKSYAVGDTSRVGSSVDNAMYYMNLAKGYSEDTAEDVQTVEELMEDLEEIETRTKGYSDSAALSKTSVDTLYSQTVIAKTSADYFATLAESWAHGQTGIRQDESVDNAMYWANKAQAVAKTTVDSAFSTSSLNPVENRVITNQHVDVRINQVNGVHGLRYYNDLLEYYDTDTSQWVEIETGGGTLIVQPPVAASQTYTYDGTEQTFQFSSIDTANCTISNNKKTAAGTYTVTVSLKETNYVWADDLTNADRTFTWTINKAQVAIPVAASQSYTYDGTQQTFAFTTTIDTTLINVTGNEQTNAGSYTVSCALVDSNNYEWADSTTAAKTYSWTIAKAASSISVSPASITFDADNLTATLVPTTTGDGTVSYAIDKPSIATIAGNVVTATQTTGTATITATISETTNYASASTTISVMASFASLVSWSSGTDAQIKAMIDAYYAGTFTLDQIKSVWSVGDARDVTISSISASGGSGSGAWSVGESHRSQTVQMVIIDFDHDTLTTSISGKTKALITVQTKDCLRDGTHNYQKDDTERGYMNSTSTSDNGWRGCARRAWCNNAFYNALPSNFKNMVKNANHITAKGNKSTSTETTIDYVFLPSEQESIGSKVHACAVEGTQYTYYATKSNRYKLPKYNSSASSAEYWGRSPCIDAGNDFVGVGTEGAVGWGTANDPRGIAPACCL